MKICFGNQLALSKMGGVARHVVELSRGLKKRGAVVQTHSAFVRRASFPGVEPEVFVNGIDVSWLPRALNPILREVNEALERHFLDSHSFDVYHPTYYGRIPSLKGDTKVVVTVHDMIHEKFPEGFKKGDRALRMKHENLVRADLVLANSARTRDDVIQILGIAKEKIRVVHHAVSALPFPGAPLVGTPYFLYVGSRFGYKNFGSLARAFRRALDEGLENVKLITFGGGPFNANERAFINELNLERNVEQFFGSDEVLSTLYSHAIALVYPSLYEGFGLPPLEAMSLGCPVIAANAGPLPEVLGGSAFFVNPTDISEIASGLSEIAVSETLRSTLKESGLVQGSKYSVDRMAVEILGAYEEVLG